MDIQIEEYFNKRQITKTIEEKISKALNKAGIFYRLWTRVKSKESIERKLEQKGRTQNYRMQDLIGCRIICYFSEDLTICEEIIKKLFTERNDDTTIDELNAETFKPVRRNFVFNLTNDIIQEIDPTLWELPFDKTFELQSRTILSEGWHEIEHDLRYKHKLSWSDSPMLERKLNGILATLETSEWALTQLLDELAYQNYKKKNWADMLRNKIRLRIKEEGDISGINNIFNVTPELAKKFLNFDKAQLVQALSGLKVAMPLTLSNLVYCINHIEIHNEEMEKIVPIFIKENIQ